MPPTNAHDPDSDLVHRRDRVDDLPVLNADIDEAAVALLRAEGNRNPTVDEYVAAVERADRGERRFTHADGSGNRCSIH